jgi:hypothetical protein
VGRIAVLSLVLALAACEGSGSSPRPPPEPVYTGPVRLVQAGPGDVPPLVIAAAADAAKEHRRLLVYVGASWCQPCEAFHAAAERGDLDAALPGLTLLTFDSDVDNDRLVEAGYQSRLIPLFAVPGPDGRGTPRATSGARTGGDYVAELVPRVQALFAREK